MGRHLGAGAAGGQGDEGHPGKGHLDHDDHGDDGDGEVWERQVKSVTVLLKNCNIWSTLGTCQLSGKRCEGNPRDKSFTFFLLQISSTDTLYLSGFAILLQIHHISDTPKV